MKNSDVGSLHQLYALSLIGGDVPELRILGAVDIQPKVKLIPAETE
jgi:hypothetical protein